MLSKLGLLDCGKSSHSSALLNRLINHNSNIDCYHDCHVDYHGEAHLELHIVVQIECSEAHEVVQLDQAEEVVDGVQDVISNQNEPRRSIEIDDIEHGDE